MRQDNRFEAIDKAALHNALLDLKTCPRCYADLRPVAFFKDVWGCDSKLHSFETWHIQKKGA